jgi:hypothetical protein
MTEHFKLATRSKEVVKAVESEEAAPNPLGGRPNGEAVDPFSDIKKLVVPQAYLGAVKVKKVLSTVGTDKPSKQTFFRIRDGEEYTATQTRRGRKAPKTQLSSPAANVRRLER